MTFPLNQPSLPGNLISVQGIGSTVLSKMQNYLITLQSGNVDSVWTGNFLTSVNGMIAQLNSVNATGLNAYATANIPNYTGTLTTDIATVVSNLQACITWVFNNFPTSNGFLESSTLSSSGVITFREFAPTQTAGLQTAIQAVISSFA